MKLQKLLSYTRRAVDDYKMISAGDRIAVGLSGGKDSLSLLVALNALKKFYPEPFEVEAVLVSLGLEGDQGGIREFCDSLGVRLTVVETDIGQIVFQERKEKNPCSLCSKMRKGALNSAAAELGCNKVALGHNKDDVIETFFMSLFYEGRISCFSPVSYLDRMELFCIRPLIYVSEWETRSFIARSGIPILKNPCPANGSTKRQEIKELIAELSKTYKNLDAKVFGAIGRSGIPGWKIDR